MNRADAIVEGFLADAEAPVDAGEWRRLAADDPHQARSALLLLRVEGLLRADIQAPTQAPAVMARLRAQVDRHIQTAVMRELRQVRHGRWSTTHSGRHTRSRPARSWLPLGLAAAACVVLLVGLVAVALRPGPASPGRDRASMAQVRLDAASSDVRLDGLMATVPRALQAGNRVEVAAGGSATLVWSDGTTAIVREAAVVELRDGDGAKRLRIAHGQVAATVAPQPAGRPMVFTTPHGEAVVVGTRLRLAVDATTTSLTVDEGLVRLVGSADGSVQEVSAGRTAVATRTGRALPARRVAQCAAYPDLDLAALVRAQAGAARCAPLLVVGEGPAPDHHTLVRVFDHLGMGVSQFLAWPPTVRGGVAVAALRLADGGLAVACAAGDATVGDIRIVDTQGARLASFTPTGVTPPFAIAAGAFVPGRSDDQIAIVPRHDAREVLLCGVDGLVLARVPLPATAPRRDLTLVTRRAAGGDRLLVGAAGQEAVVVLAPATGAAQAEAEAETLPAAVRTRVASTAARRWQGDQAQIHLTAAVATDPGAGLWLAGFPDQRFRERLDRLAACYRAAPDACVGIMPGPPDDDPRWRPGTEGFAAFLLRRHHDLPTINRHFRTAFATEAAVEPPAGRGRGAWDRLDAGNAYFVAWQHYREIAAATLLFQAARDALLAGFPPDRVLLPASPRDPGGLPKRAGAVGMLYAAGTGLALDCAAEDLAAADGLLAGAVSSGHGDAVLFRVRPPLPRDVDRLLAAAGVRFFPSGTGLDADLPGQAPQVQVAGPPRSTGASGANPIVLVMGPERPPLLAGITSAGAGDGTVLLTPFRTRIAIEPLAPAPPRILDRDAFTSAPIRDCGPGDQVEITFRARTDQTDAAVTIQVVRSDLPAQDATRRDPVEVPDTRQVFPLGRADTVCRYALRFQIHTGPVQVVIRSTTRSGQRVVLEDVQATVQRAGAALPDIDRDLGRPYRGTVAWDVFPERPRRLP